MLFNRGLSTWCLNLGVLALLGLSACAPIPQAPVAEAPVIVGPSAAERQAQDIATLLAAAEEAVAGDRLMSPAHDNAYDRYRAVLLLDSGNIQAKTGLQQVLLRYLKLAKSAIGKGRFDRARTYLTRARIVDARHPEIDRIEAAMRQQQVAEEKANNEEAADGEFVFSSGKVAARDAEVVKRLQAIALRMKETGEVMQIRVKTDADGRWIYKQMKAAVPGYRLRGDIRLGKRVKVILQPPID